MLYSKAAEYAIRAMVYLAEQTEGELIQLKDVAEKEDIPFHFLAKTMQILSRKGLVRSHRGPRGGFCLSRPPEEITLYDIVDPIDHIANYDEICILGIDVCSDEAACPLHDDWTKIRAQIRLTLEGKNLAQMVGKLEEKRRLVKEKGLN
ncbi:MAG: Rrf2 family transcriptional regulator [Candidatus Krumholzibacteriia bacterium]|nr:Rrf2 family transcriptional regulator [bacterium]MCB9513336.1 Rrf2 family transcriptional regulator [Candidatus Latescibacterota bacterium]MCB9516049.1 Rrf2 family transcriptional regulator [Candidatus Latescibacterota bacterium]